MKNLFKKNKALIVILGVIVIVIAVFAVYRIMNPIYTFDDITNNKAELVAKIESQGVTAPESEQRMLNEYKNKRFKQSFTYFNSNTSQYDMTANIYFECYDNKGDLLFKIEIYNEDVINVQVDGTSHSYSVV